MRVEVFLIEGNMQIKISKGKPVVTLSQLEWVRIGTQKGWLKMAQPKPAAKPEEKK